MVVSKAPDWTGDVVRDLHLNDIAINELAGAMGISREWVSQVLNGKKTPAGAEERFRKRVAEIIRERAEDA